MTSALLCEGGDEVRVQPQGLGEVIQVFKDMADQMNCLPCPLQSNELVQSWLG